MRKAVAYVSDMMDDRVWYEYCEESGYCVEVARWEKLYDGNWRFCEVDVLDWSVFHEETIYIHILTSDNATKGVILWFPDFPWGLESSFGIYV